MTWLVAILGGGFGGHTVSRLLHSSLNRRGHSGEARNSCLSSLDLASPLARRHAALAAAWSSDCSQNTACCHQLSLPPSRSKYIPEHPQIKPRTASALRDGLSLLCLGVGTHSANGMDCCAMLGCGGEEGAASREPIGTGEGGMAKRRGRGRGDAVLQLVVDGEW